ncbi:hypothetical protein MNBD_DELTA01-763 [hydrothermal vent metagenome]|uniref:Uncharacterized protein n=1 Tax=hydrothermal vent metagenome TaxID=652676 RepID=A0A3B0QR03_9ZZZZ
MEIKFCSFGCKHAKAEQATSAAKSCMTFNSVYCKKLKRRISKGTICPAEKAKPSKP